MIILINLVFWFINAPDTRFAYGFIFTGFALTLACIAKIIEYSKMNIVLKPVKLYLVILLLIIVGRRISFPADTLKDPSAWVLPVKFGPVETKEYNTSGFVYRVPVAASECYYTEIPCTAYPKNNLVLRGKSLKEGFKLVTETR